MNIKVLIISFFSMLVGCASFNSGLIKDINSADLEKIKSAKIIYQMGQVADVEIDGKKYTYTIDDRMQSYGFANYSTLAENEICKEKPCRDLPTDLELYIDYSIKTNMSLIKAFSAIAFVVTLGLFPGNDEYEIIMNAVALDHEKKIIGRYHLEDTVNIYYDTLLLIAAPFLNTHTVSETIENMRLTLIFQADAELHNNHHTSSASLK